MQSEYNSIFVTHHERTPGLVSLHPDPAETIYTAQGTYTILQANAECAEDVDLLIESNKARGISMSKPGEIDPATREIIPFVQAESLMSDFLPVVVYVALNCERSVVSKFQNN